MEKVNLFLESANAVLWHDYVLFIILAVGVLFTVWSGFSQFVALTHGVQVIRGRYDRRDAPGAISHFQALSAALSATVGLGNIGGVAVAIALGGPGAVFWMWVVGLVGMALKTTEVTLAMLHRNTADPDNPHGGPMWVAQKGFAAFGPGFARIGTAVGGIFCVTLLISAITGGNMFQAWNVGVVTEQNFGIPQPVTGIVLAITVALVIVGGIKRIGAVAGRLVPMMCVLYLLAACYVLAANLGQIPEILRLIVLSAFSPAESSGAFLGGTAGYAFLWGMKRALFSNEAGQGSSPIAHSAARTSEPVREGVVAGLEPFIDTLVVCTLTALVILSSGAWNRGPEVELSTPPIAVAAGEGRWTFADTPLPANPSGAWIPGQDQVFLIAHASRDERTGTDLTRVSGTVVNREGRFWVQWGTLSSSRPPRVDDRGVYGNYVGAALTSHAFDRVQPGLGKWLVTLAAWLFAVSTMISWSYYGEQGMVYLFGLRSVLAYKLAYCALIIVATAGLVTTDAALDNLTGFGTGVMLFANIPIMVLFGRQAMRAYHDYVRRMKEGAFAPHAAPPIVDVVEGRSAD